jgi:hypothetical protein
MPSSDPFRFTQHKSGSALIATLFSLLHELLEHHILYVNKKEMQVKEKG